MIAGGGLADVSEACADIFTARDKHAWPPELVVYPSWAEAYKRLAIDQGFAITDFEEAAAQVGEFIAEVDAAT